jgi:hypothetical protein
MGGRKEGCAVACRVNSGTCECIRQVRSRRSRGVAGTRSENGGTPPEVFRPFQRSVPVKKIRQKVSLEQETSLDSLEMLVPSGSKSSGTPRNSLWNAFFFLFTS